MAKLRGNRADLKQCSSQKYDYKDCLRKQLITTHIYDYCLVATSSSHSNYDREQRRKSSEVISRVTKSVKGEWVGWVKHRTFTQEAAICFLCQTKGQQSHAHEFSNVSKA